MNSNSTANITFLSLKKVHSRKEGMKSSPYGLYELGYTRATMEITKSCNFVKYSKSQNNFLSSNYRLKLVYMKLESLVIVNQHVTVNMLLGFVHTARHILEEGPRIKQL